MRAFIQYLGKFLKSIDIYGQKVELNFKKQNSFKTIFGGILTFFILFLFVLGCWFYGKELVEKQKPSVISSQRSVAMPKRIDIKKDNLIIVIGISDGQSKVYSDPTIFSLRAVQETLGYYNYTLGKQIKKMIPKELKLKTCTIDDIGISGLVDYFQELDLTQNYCFDENQEVYMEGDFDAERFSILYVYAEKCKNSTMSNIICKPPDVINKQLAFSKIKVSISDNIVDPLNFKNPFAYKGISFASQTSSSSPKEVTLAFANQFIESDVGFLFEQIESINSYIFNDMKETSYFNDPDVLVRLQLRVQKQSENLMQRRYQRFADVVAQIGGLLKILTTLGGLICYPFTKLHLFKSVVDQLFQFDFNEKNSCSLQKSSSPEDISPNFQSQCDISKTDKKKKIDSFNQKQEKDCKISIKQVNKNQNNIETFAEQSCFGNKLLEIDQNQKVKKTELNNHQVKTKDKLLQKKKDYFQNSHKVIKYTFFNMISHIFFPKLKHIRQQKELIENGISKIYEHLDVFYILNKLLEIDKIKSILLNQDQLKLFEYIPKPVISNEKQFNESEQVKLNQNQNEQETYNNFITYENKQKIPSYNDQIKQETLNKAQQVYSLYQKVKSDEQKAIDACQGLTNILNQNKLSKIDESLINLIDPIIIENFEKINNEQEFNNNDKMSFLNSQMEEKNNIQEYQLSCEQSDYFLREKELSFSNKSFAKRINEIKQQKHNYLIRSFSSRRSNDFELKLDKIKEQESQQMSKNLDQFEQQNINEQSKLSKQLNEANTKKINNINQNCFTNQKLNSNINNLNEQPHYFVQPDQIQEQANQIYLFQNLKSSFQQNGSQPNKYLQSPNNENLISIVQANQKQRQLIITNDKQDIQKE